MMGMDMTDTDKISKNCLMDFDQATLVLGMLEKHIEFSDIGVDIKYDFESLEPFQDSEGKVLVTFNIPRTVFLPSFFGEFYKALNPELFVLRPKEK